MGTSSVLSLKRPADRPDIYQGVIQAGGRTPTEDGQGHGIGRGGATDTQEDGVSPGQARILVVDDEPQICTLIREGLSRQGLDCLAVSRPREAKDLLESNSFDVLLTDISMPSVSGLDLLSYVRHHQPACKVILITGLGEADHLAEAIRNGAFDFVRKPLDLPDLCRRVAQAAGRAPTGPGLPLRAAQAMQSADRIKRASLESIYALAKAVEAKDPYTRRHSEQVSHNATCIARKLAQPPEAVESIRIAGLLHDIGKIGVPDDILTKPGRLTDEEFEYIRRHPALGGEILEHISMFAEEARIVRHHHERWDGAGYPDGVAGRDIPYAGRIINVADSIDAMLMARTYKQAYPVDQVVAELRRCAGTQFDPEIAEAAAEWLEGLSGQGAVPTCAA